MHLNKGVVLSAGGKDSAALKCFDKAIELKPELTAAHFNKANVYKTSNQAKLAVDSYKTALKLDPSQQAGWYGLAHCSNEIDDHAGALEAADKSIALAGSGSPHEPSHNERVFSLLKLGRGAEAVQDIDILTKLTPVDKLDARAKKLYSIVLSTAAIERAAAGANDEALVFHARAANTDPTFANLFNHAVCLIQNEKPDDALKVLHLAKAKDANNWKVHAAIGTIAMQKRTYKEAADAFAQAVTFPEMKDDETVNFNLGVSYMNLGNQKSAQAPLERVTAVNRNNWTAQALLGTIYIDDDDYKRAENVLFVASNIAGGNQDASVFYNLGYAQLMLGKGDPALKSFQAALAIDPANAQAKAAIEALIASPEEVKKSMRDGLQAKLDEKERIKQADMAKWESITDPVERAKLMIAPQRPNYLRRKSMEGIEVGRVMEMRAKFEQLKVQKI